MNEFHEFFRELEECYARERHDFAWDWESLVGVAGSRNLPSGVDMLSDYVCFIAYNLAKNILHGQLPDNLHNRMIFQKSEWSRKYFEFLER